ncbi:MAG: GNAT family N-acetyltransferase, partial [Rhodospirillales bacterium]
YPATPEDLSQRFLAVRVEDRHLVLIAENGGQDILGMIHATVLPMMMESPQMIVLSLIVAERARGQNIGALLLSSAEKWAKDRGVELAMVGSNVVRDRAHRFYQANGYQEIKRWSVLKKKL